VNRKFAIPGVTAGTPLAEAAPAILVARAKPLFRLLSAAAGGTDEDAVHDMRVASRRLREAMRLFGPLYPGRDFAAWYRVARRVTRALGPVRDADVFVGALTELAAVVGVDGQRCIAFHIGYRMGGREREIVRLGRTLSKLGLATGRRDFERVAGAPDMRSPLAGASLASHAHSLIAVRGEAVAQAQPGALAECRVDEQHALRIDYKRLRYAVEVFAPCYGASFDGLHEVLSAFQEALGELHDAHVFRQELTDPLLADAAARAGVDSAATREVDAALSVRAHEQYERFSVLAKTHPADSLLSGLLLPLDPASEEGRR
jgi:CHAD domain-containing protein